MARNNYTPTSSFSLPTPSRFQSGETSSTSLAERVLQATATSFNGHRRLPTSLLGKTTTPSRPPYLHSALTFFMLLSHPLRLCPALGLNVEDLGWDRSVASCHLSASEDGRRQASSQFTATVYHSAKGIQGFEPVAVVGMCDFSGGLEFLFVPCESTEQPHHLSYQPPTSISDRAGQSAAKAPEEQEGWLFWAKKKATKVVGFLVNSPLEMVLTYLDDRLAKNENYWLLCKGYPPARNAAFTPIINWGWTLRRYASKDFDGHVPTIPAFHLRS